MFFRIIKANEHAVYIPILIGCNRYKCRISQDGVLDEVYCPARGRHRRCRGCNVRKRRIFR